jgi:hypothetical protein
MQSIVAPAAEEQWQVALGQAAGGHRCRDDIAAGRPRAGCPVQGKRLVQRAVDSLSQAFDLILDQEFAALQFNDTQVVRGKMYKSLVQFGLQKLMFTFQFNEMRLNRHI